MQRKKGPAFCSWDAFLSSTMPFPAKREQLLKHPALLLKDPGPHRFKLWQLAIDSSFYSDTVKLYNRHHSSSCLSPPLLNTLRSDIKGVLAKYQQDDPLKATRLETQISTLLTCHPSLIYHPSWLYLLVAMLDHFEDYNLFVFLSHLIFQFYPKGFFQATEPSFDYLSLSLHQFIDNHLPRLAKPMTSVWKDSKNRRSTHDEALSWLTRRLASRFYHYLFLDLVDLPQTIQVLDVFMLTSYEAVYSSSLALLQKHEGVLGHYLKKQAKHFLRAFQSELSQDLLQLAAMKTLNSQVQFQNHPPVPQSLQNNTLLLKKEPDLSHTINSKMNEDMNYKKQDIFAYRKKRRLPVLLVASLRNPKLRKIIQIQKIDLDLDVLAQKEQERKQKQEHRNAQVLPLLTKLDLANESAHSRYLREIQRAEEMSNEGTFIWADDFLLIMVNILNWPVHLVLPMTLLLLGPDSEDNKVHLDRLSHLLYLLYSSLSDQPIPQVYSPAHLKDDSGVLGWLVHSGLVPPDTPQESPLEGVLQDRATILRDTELEEQPRGAYLNLMSPLRRTPLHSETEEEEESEEDKASEEDDSQEANWSMSVPEHNGGGPLKEINSFIQEHERGRNCGRVCGGDQCMIQ